MQIHYAVERPKGDISGINLSLSSDHVPFSAGMMMFASSFQIPPKQETHLVPNRCCYSGFEPAHGFAFRVHTHMLGRQILFSASSGLTCCVPAADGGARLIACAYQHNRKELAPESLPSSGVLSILIVFPDVLDRQICLAIGDGAREEHNTQTETAGSCL